jgi:hypothetical protein
MQKGDGVFSLALNDAKITVEGHRDGDRFSAALQSPPTRTSSMREPASSVRMRWMAGSGRLLTGLVPGGSACAGAAAGAGAAVWASTGAQARTAVAANRRELRGCCMPAL